MGTFRCPSERSEEPRTWLSRRSKTTYTSRSLTAFFATTFAMLTPLDWLLLALALWSIIRGFRRGLIHELFALVALIAGLTAASWNYTTLALWLARWLPQPASAAITAFLLLALGVTIGVLLVGRLVRSAARLVGLGPLDRLAGALFGLARASVLGAAILMACITFLPPMPWLDHSRLVPPLLQIAHTAAMLAPANLQQRISAAITGLRGTSQ